jgi:hypothetical protein
MFGLLLALCIDGLLSACMVSLCLVGRCCQLLLSFARKGLVVIIFFFILHVGDACF